jgi:hypothetical protein
MNTKDLLHLGNKEDSIIMKKLTEEKIMINRGMNSEGIYNKEYHSLLGIKVSFWLIVLIVLTLDIKLWIAENMKEMFM